MPGPFSKNAKRVSCLFLFNILGRTDDADVFYTGRQQRIQRIWTFKPVFYLFSAGGNHYDESARGGIGQKGSRASLALNKCYSFVGRRIDLQAFEDHRVCDQFRVVLIKIEDTRENGRGVVEKFKGHNKSGCHARNSFSYGMFGRSAVSTDAESLSGVYAFMERVSNDPGTCQPARPH